MNTSKLTLLVAGALTAIALTAPPVTAAQKIVIRDVSGEVNIQQGMPCGDPLIINRMIEGGHVEITPYFIMRDREVVGVTFDLTRLDVSIEPFSVHRVCMGVDATADFRQIFVRLASSVRFPGEATGAPGSMLWRFRIPKEEFLIHERIFDNADVPQPEEMYRHPSEDVTGIIDLHPDHRSLQIHVVLSDEMRFRGGCVKGHCLVDEKRDGITTSDVFARNGGGNTPPTVSCTPVRPPGNGFQVHAEGDDPVIHFGTYLLRNDEIIQIQQTGQPGVRKLTSPRAGGISDFQVGPGDGFVVVTDNTNLTAIAYCIK